VASSGFFIWFHASNGGVIARERCGTSQTATIENPSDCGEKSRSCTLVNGA
jgi:hypothetical protein